MSKTLDFCLSVLVFWFLMWVLFHINPISQWLDYVIRVPNA